MAYKQAKSNMRNSVIGVIIVAVVVVGCSSSTEGPDPNVDAAPSDGINSDSSTPRDAGLSYAPCDTCCDPIAQNCPAPMQACFENAQSNGTYCETAGTRPAGASCSTDNDCVAGTTCLQLGFNQCRAFCLTNTDCAVTPSTPTCVLYNVPPGRNAYGLCF